MSNRPLAVRAPDRAREGERRGFRAVSTTADTADLDTRARAIAALLDRARDEARGSDGELLLVAMMLVHVGPQKIDDSWCTDYSLGLAVRRGWAVRKGRAVTATDLCRAVARVLSEVSRDR